MSGASRNSKFADDVAASARMVYRIVPPWVRASSGQESLAVRFNSGLFTPAAMVLSFCACATAHGQGASALKSGPIQASADGMFVWFVNPDHGTVSRLATDDNSVMEFALPAEAVGNKPRALALRPGADEVWVASHESDRLHVLEASTGMPLETVVLPHGSAPIGVAFTADGTTAAVTLYRAGAVALVDASARTVTTMLGNLPEKPMGIVLNSAGMAWVSHLYSDGDNGYVSVLDLPNQRVYAVLKVRSLDPKFNFQLQGENPPIPEGGWVLPTAHVAISPANGALWMPMQLQNFRATTLTPHTSIQAAVLRINTATNVVDLNDRIIFTAIVAHSNSNQLLGDGWNAGVSGPADIAFSNAGGTALIVMSQSNDVLVVPSTTGQAKPNGNPPLTEIAVGDNPIGIAWSPTAPRAYVLNYLSRDVSVINTSTMTELVRVPGVISAEPLSPTVLTGAKMFNNSSNFQHSLNQKVSCASCHPGGESDGLVWDFFSIGAGRRKTLSMRGQAISMAPQANGRGQLHRSGDRDEIQDFDLAFSGNFMLGTGYLFPANPPLGASNAGISPDLDSLADFILNLPPIMRSPHREADGSLTEAAVRGAMLFRITEGPLATGCITCHPAPAYTDFGFHNVGGFRPLPDNEGPAFNTPTLVGSWDSGGFRQIIPIGGAAITRQSGVKMWDVLRATAPGGVQQNLHGNMSNLSNALMRDLEAFLNELDGDLHAAGIDDLVDTTPPRVLAVRPVSMNSVEVIFSEAVDPVTAGDPANYALTDGVSTIPAVAAVHNAAEGNRVRVTVPMVWYGCDVTYTLVPGPIEDMAAALGAPANNVLDSDDANNLKSFTIDGTITVTFGDSGLDTFVGVGIDAGFTHNDSNVSHDHMILIPTTFPKTKGLLRFNFTGILSTQSGVTDPASIVDARYTLMPDHGAPTTIDVRRIFKPWNDPDRDACNSCPGSVTTAHAQWNTLQWTFTGARSLGGTGTNAAEYHPNQSFFDGAGVADAVVPITRFDQRIEIAGPGVTDAFRFWLANPSLNYGHFVDIVGTTGPSIEFWSAEFDGGHNGPVLSITFSVPLTPAEPDCNGNGRVDWCDIASGASQDVDENGVPDECELPDCPADWNDSGQTDVPDIFAFLADWFAGNPRADYDGVDGVGVSDIFAFLADWFAGCPD
ncbi:MAG: hypothetical protein KF699_08270 [Phycisphaeraceae bacterium]|nr:hypothetical protein [Phycisphaeraceae bacterium]